MKTTLLLAVSLIGLLPIAAEEPAGLYIDPAKAAADADFAHQGEYAGMVGGKKVGLQLVAEGEGKFRAGMDGGMAASRGRGCGRVGP
jgi:hypothetical protein